MSSDPMMLLCQCMFYLFFASRCGDVLNEAAALMPVTFDLWTRRTMTLVLVRLFILEHALKNQNVKIAIYAVCWQVAMCCLLSADCVALACLTYGFSDLTRFLPCARSTFSFCRSPETFQSMRTDRPRIITCAHGQHFPWSVPFSNLYWFIVPH